MEALVLEWLNLAFRWFHVVAAIAWIGASFYFIWLDLNLREPPDWKAAQGIKGDLWAIHGGGIYEVAKYHLRPAQMPQKLHWFKWEAYSTWLSGSGLLILMYYLQAQTYLVGYHTWVQSPLLCVLASASFLISGQLCYELLLRTPLVKRGLYFGIALSLLLTLASWLAHHLFSPRAAFIHVGALMATWMAGNVFWGIIPAQKQFIAAVSAGENPDVQAMGFAKLRSTHNNYLTLPVIFCMISNHYAFVYGHAYAWIGLIVIGLLLAWVRHFFNLKHLGVVRPSILVSGFAGLVLVAIAMSATSGLSSASAMATGNEPGAQVTAVDNLTPQVASILSHHCSNCHAAAPTQPGFSAPPAGLIIDTPEHLAQLKVRALPALGSGYMPLGNMTQLSDVQRKLLIDWLSQQ